MPGPVLVAQVVDQGGAGREQPVDLLVHGAVGRPEVEVDAVLDRLALGHLDEQHPLAAVRGEDHALLVAGQVGVARVLGEAQDLAPPDRLVVGVAGVDAGVRDA